MKLKTIHTTRNCNSTSCPTIYQNEQGNYVLQGYKVKPTLKDDLEVPEDEDLIELPKEFVQDFIVPTLGAKTLAFRRSFQDDILLSWKYDEKELIPSMI